MVLKNILVSRGLGMCGFLEKPFLEVFVGCDEFFDKLEGIPFSDCQLDVCSRSSHIFNYASKRFLVLLS